MAESLVQVTEGSGKKLHTNSRVIGANTVEDEYTLQGENFLPSYIASPATGVSMAATDDVAQLMAGASLNVRIRRIRCEQYASITAAANVVIQVFRVTSAGTGGTVVTPNKLENGDAASGATAASGVPTATHGTAGALLFTRSMFPVQTAPAGGLATMPYWEWNESVYSKPIIIPAGTTNGIVLRNAGARAGLSVMWEIEFTETSF